MKDQASKLREDVIKAKHQEVLDMEWFQTRPEIVKELILNCPPYYTYEMKSTGHHCHIYSYGECLDGCEGTVTVKVLKDGGFFDQHFNDQEGPYSHAVFGIKPKDLKIIGMREDSCTTK